MSNKAKNIELTPRNLTFIGTSIQMFNGHRFELRGEQAVKQIHYFVGGKSQRIDGEIFLIKEIYHNIHKVFDEHGVCIARKHGKHGRLLTTGKGEAKDFRPVENDEVFKREILCI